jgi:hypothetical protein
MKKMFLILFFISFNALAQISSGEKITSEIIDDIKDKVEYKRKCVTKVLSSNKTYGDLPNQVSPNNKNGYLDSMKITGLTLGQRYEVFLEGYFLNIATVQHELRVLNADNVFQNYITQLRAYNSGSTTMHYEIQTSKNFIALTDTVSVNLSINSLNGPDLSVLVGSNGSTRLKVCEANHREDVSSF